MGPDTEVSNFSRTAREDENTPDESNGNDTLYDLYKRHEEGYERFCTIGNSAISASTYKDYVGAITTWGNLITTPDDIKEFYTNNEIKLSEKVGKAFGKLKSYFAELPDDIAPAKFNGYSLDKFTTAFNRAESNIGAQEESTAMDVSRADLKKWYASIPYDMRPFFLMLAYSGSRIDQLYSVLKMSREEKLRRVEEIRPDKENKLSRPVFRLKVKDLGSGRKNMECLYFPPSMKDLVLSYSPGFTVDHFGNQATPAHLNKKKKQKITPKTLRKWNTNRFLQDQKVPAEIAGWIEGRIPSARTSAAHITWKNYGDLDTFAAAAYADAEPLLLEWLPFDLQNPPYAPETDKAPVDPQPPKDQPAPKAGKRGPKKGSAPKGGVPRKEVDYKKVERMLKAGKLHREIIAETGINKTRLSEFVKKNPQYKKK